MLPYLQRNSPELYKLPDAFKTLAAVNSGKEATEMETVTIPKTTAICAARYFVAAHESAILGRPVNFGGPCIRCSENQRCFQKGAVLDWTEVMRPLFDAVGGILVQLARGDSWERTDDFAEEVADFVKSP